MNALVGIGAASLAVAAASTIATGVMIAARVAAAARGITASVPPLTDRDTDAPTPAARWTSYAGIPFLTVDEHLLAQQVGGYGGVRVPREVAVAAVAEVAVARATGRQ